ncbi:MAG: MiaB/RimO family radical SAM methylthiotransferase [Planctomycetes bacterium]|nr:MiaB/RimO family radical SAM methylthiotransferase [Planctomycetota bacterium]
MPENIWPPAIRAHTFGCKVNFCDTNALLEAAAESGFKRAPEGSQAAVEIINTCAVTARSVQKARGLIRHIRAANRRAAIVVTGCAVRTREKTLLEMPEPDAFCDSVRTTLEYVCRLYGLRSARLAAGFDPARTRAFLKVQEGCDAFCSYCVVPYARGKPRSVPEEEVLSAFQRALESGYREIVLTGTHLGIYGRDIPPASLPSLMQRIDALSGGFRVRTSSIEPREVSDELLDVMGSSKTFCPHLHVPLQSGSNRILQAMGRPYGREEFLETLGRARSALNNPAITTDIMAGFPGETERDHLDTLDLMRQAGFTRAHVFVFSPRSGTAAVGLAGRVDGRLAKHRSGEIRALAEESARTFRRSLFSERLEVLPEVSKDGFLEGFCRRYQRVRIKKKRELLGTLVNVYITGESGDGKALESRLE